MGKNHKAQKAELFSPKLAEQTVPAKPSTKKTRAKPPKSPPVANEGSTPPEPDDSVTSGDQFEQLVNKMGYNQGGK